MQTFEQFQAVHLPKVEQECIKFMKENVANARLQEAMRYSMRAGGKRLRPLLLLATVASFGKELSEAAYQVAASLEMIHTYSLIHDDLPAMDNDDLRRGVPTNHKVFGEATAILAGDALLTGAFQLVSTSQLAMSEKVLLIQLLSKSAGAKGMVAGQMGDIQGETQTLSLDELTQVHEQKTGALIEFALLAGGILAQQTEEVVQALGEFAQHFGLAFQIRDDILDEIGSAEALGKAVRKDAALNKSTYPRLLGLAGAKHELEQQINRCQRKLTQIHELNDVFMVAWLQQMLTQLALP